MNETSSNEILTRKNSVTGNVCVSSRQRWRNQTVHFNSTMQWMQWRTHTHIVYMSIDEIENSRLINGRWQRVESESDCQSYGGVGPSYPEKGVDLTSKSKYSVRNQGLAG